MLVQIYAAGETILVFFMHVFPCVAIHNQARVAEALNAQRLPGHIREMVSA